MELDRTHGNKVQQLSNKVDTDRLLSNKVQHLRAIPLLVYKLIKQRMDGAFEHNTEVSTAII